MNTLEVYFRDEHCARLHEGPQGQLALRYLDSWIERKGTPVSVRLPVTDETFGHELIAPFVASFLPEGETLRHRLEKLLHVDADHDFGLLSVIGRESAGALSFWPEDEQPATANARYVPLSEHEFARWKEYAHRSPLQFPGREIRLSLAGAQSKTALYFDEADVPYLPENGAPTTHIVKPAILGCRPSSVFVELITMRIARSVLGSDRVPEADIWQNCYRVRRFDRRRTEQVVFQLHQEDFCLALGRMPHEKYESSSPRERLLAPCFELIDQLGERGLVQWPAVQRMHLLDQVVINVLLHNPDAHLKNHALLYAEEGSLEIAPLYDCLCTSGLTFQPNEALAWEAGPGPEAHTRNLSLRIGNAEQIDRIGMADWESFATECGFTQAFVRRRVRMLAESVADQMTAVAESVQNDVPAAEPAAREILQGVSGQVRMVLGKS